MRNLKVLGLALIAVFAMSAVTASAALAADDLTAESYPTTLTGNQDGQIDIFSTTAGTVSCKKASYHGTIAGPSTTITATPAYSECTGLGFPAVIDMNGCDYLFHMEGPNPTTSTVDILCPVGKEITVTSIAAGTTKCTIHVPEQKGLKHVEWTNVGAGVTREITGHITIEGLKYSHTAGTGLGACATGSSTTGVYNGKVTVTGEKEPPLAGHVGIFFSA